MTAPGQRSKGFRRVRDRFTARVLGVFLAVAFSLWAFLTVAGEMAEGETRSLDERLLLMLRVAGDPGNPVGPRWLEEAMRDITALGGFTVLTLITLTTVVALFRSGRARQAWIVAAMVIGAELSSDLLKLAYARPRPDLVPHGSYVYSNSFPSGHSTISVTAYFVVAIVLASLVRRHQSKTMIYGVGVLLITAIGLSRVYLGVHWPTDVLAGWALGSSWAVLGWFLLSLNPPHRSMTP
jgi:undecaprenyl-diphosphatase